MQKLSFLYLVQCSSFDINSRRLINVALFVSFRATKYYKVYILHLYIDKWVTSIPSTNEIHTFKILNKSIYTYWNHEFLEFNVPMLSLLLDEPFDGAVHGFLNRIPTADLNLVIFSSKGTTKIQEMSFQRVENLKISESLPWSFV